MKIDAPGIAVSRRVVLLMAELFALLRKSAEMSNSELQTSWEIFGNCVHPGRKEKREEAVVWEEEERVENINTKRLLSLSFHSVLCAVCFPIHVCSFTVELVLAGGKSKC